MNDTNSQNVGFQYGATIFNSGVNWIEGQRASIRYGVLRDTSNTLSVQRVVRICKVPT